MKYRMKYLIGAVSDTQINSLLNNQHINDKYVPGFLDALIQSLHLADDVGLVQTRNIVLHTHTHTHTKQNMSIRDRMTDR